MTSRPSGPAFPLASFALLLVLVFTIAYWAGRTVGPEGSRVDPTPHTSQDGHR